jgi:hypothetical protein
MWQWLLVTGCLLFTGGARPSNAIDAQGPAAYVIAPSASTRLEARRLLRICRWSDTTIVRDADLVLVVVRSSGSDPLAPSYDSLRWLLEAANSQLNDSGAQFHIYLYTIRSDISLLQTSHQSYDANPSGELTPPGRASPSPYPNRILYPCG